MFVYLVRHGEALEESVDPARPLSPQGHHEVRAVAHQLAALASAAMPTPIRLIHHSGKRRTEQTAQILAAALAPHAQLVPTDHLGPNDDPRLVADKLNAARAQPNAVMVVGHLPHLGRLASLLLGADSDLTPIRFATASVAALSWQESDGWAVDWVLSSRLAHP